MAKESGVEFDFRPAEVKGLTPGTSGEIFIAGQSIRCGYLGQVEDPDLAFAVFAAEIDADALTAATHPEVSAPSRFPGVAVDLTLTHRLDIEWAAIASAIREMPPDDLQEFGLKDRYSGDGVPAGAVNTTIFFFYNSASGSLTREEVNDRHERLAGELRRKFGQED